MTDQLIATYIELSFDAFATRERLRKMEEARAKALKEARMRLRRLRKEGRRQLPAVSSSLMRDILYLNRETIEKQYKGNTIRFLRDLITGTIKKVELPPSLQAKAKVAPSAPRKKRRTKEMMAVERVENAVVRNKDDQSFDLHVMFAGNKEKVLRVHLGDKGRPYVMLNGKRVYLLV